MLIDVFYILDIILVNKINWEVLILFFGNIFSNDI